MPLAARGTVLLTLLTVAAVAFGSPSQAADDTTLFLSSAGGFEMKVPARVRGRFQISSTITVNGVRTQFNVLALDTGDGAVFLVGGEELPEKLARMNNDQFYRAYLAAASSEADIRFQGQRKYTLLGKAGIEADCLMAGQMGVLRFVRLAPNRLLLVGALSRRGFRGEHPVLATMCASVAITLEGPAANPRLGPFRPDRVPTPDKIPGVQAFWSFDDGMGGTAQDGSRSKLAAAIHEAEWTEGIQGQALAFNGKDSYLDLGSDLALDIPEDSPFTLAGWFYLETDLPSHGPILCFQSPGGTGKDSYLRIGLHERRLLVHLRPADSDDANLMIGLGARDRAKLNQWHHFALLRDEQGRVRLYIDGAMQGGYKGSGARGAIVAQLRRLGSDAPPPTSDSSRPPSPTGGRPAELVSHGSHFAGKLDEFALFLKALSDEEMAKLAGRGP